MSRHWVKSASDTRCKVKEGQVREGKVVVMQLIIFSQIARVSEYRTALLGISWPYCVGHDQRGDLYTVSTTVDGIIPASLACFQAEKL